MWTWKGETHKGLNFSIFENGSLNILSKMINQTIDPWIYYFAYKHDKDWNLNTHLRDVNKIKIYSTPKSIPLVLTIF